MYWLDRGYEPAALFSASMAGENVTRLHFADDENCTQDAHSLTLDPELGILFWTQPHRSTVRAVALRYSLKTVNF
ncbi:unnamed protein product [Gongylonema pulchrum]|uniref:DDE_Tnp_1 domain-containing protein n=1 Tax=Gongylonema pulchrum TaxID=637853 RepID=A0A183ETW4_9BILA|nr:unnamed protein product [Gongylonema pulchrum]